MSETHVISSIPLNRLLSRTDDGELWFRRYAKYDGVQLICHMCRQTVVSDCMTSDERRCGMSRSLLLFTEECIEFRGKVYALCLEGSGLPPRSCRELFKLTGGQVTHGSL